MTVSPGSLQVGVTSKESICGLAGVSVDTGVFVGGRVGVLVGITGVVWREAVSWVDVDGTVGVFEGVRVRKRIISCLVV